MTALILAALLGAGCAVIAFLVAEKAELLRQRGLLRSSLAGSERRTQRLAVINRRRAALLKSMRSRLKRWQQFSAAVEAIAQREARACGESEGRAALYEEVLDHYKDMERTAWKLAGRLAAKEQIDELKEAMSRMAEALRRVGR
jgi:hypothetical protein